MAIDRPGDVAVLAQLLLLGLAVVLLLVGTVAMSLA